MADAPSARDPFPHLRPFREALPFLRFWETTRYRARASAPDVCDFMFGNPHDMPLPPYVGALAKNLVPLDKDWFAYKLSEPVATRTVAASLSARTGVAFSPDDVHMTTGGFAAIAASLRAVCAPGDEVVFLSPPWFFYELLVHAAGAKPVRVRLEPPRFDLDAEAVARAITPRTRAVIVNTPHNPSGRVYSDGDLAALAKALDDASRAHGRTVFLLSDEAYWRVAFDGRRVPTPATHYAATLVLYSYGKQLLAPGQRVGYVAWSPAMPDREALREALFLAQSASGWVFPNALLQHALPEIDAMCIDVARLQRRRDRLVPALRAMGYETTNPEATFYVLVKAPACGEEAFVDRLADRDAFVLPGSVVEVPGWVRLSLTANDAMIERALPAFEACR
jgi:aspartate aminotransferase